MASYAASEQRLAAAISELHAYLFTGRRADEKRLLAEILRGARALDRHLGTRGRIGRAVRPLVRRFRKGPRGADLLVFLQAVAGLSYAADRVRRRPREATKAASELVVALSLHLAPAAEATALVDAFESGRVDFGEFCDRFQDLLESRGVLRAAEFARAANLAFDLHALWNGKASAETKRVMATVAVATAGFACAVFVEALRALGRYRETPFSRLVPAVAAILTGLGGQP